MKRKVCDVRCEALLFDLGASVAAHPALLHEIDYSFTQQVGARLHREGHPGIKAPSARHPAGACHAIFKPTVLGNPRAHCTLTYRLDGRYIRVEKRPGVTWRRLAVWSL